MINRVIERYCNIPLIALLVVLVCSLSAAISLVSGSQSSALPYSPKNILSVRDDHCYSELSRLSAMGGPFGTPNFGLVNAIVNVPIYDWDQSGPGPLSPYSQYKLLGKDTLSLSPGLRGSLQGKSVGYAEQFNFTTTPVPNLQWMLKYFERQAAYDIGVLTTFFGMPNAVPQPNPHIANPFIYTQSSIIDPLGFPKFQAVRNTLLGFDETTGVAGEGTINEGIIPVGEDGAPIPVEEVNYDELDIDDIGIGNLGGDAIRDSINAHQNNLRDNSGLLTGILGNRGNIATQINQIYSGGVGQVDRLIGNLLNIGPLRNLGASAYRVNGADPRDRCYETISSTNHVPAYAFSVPNVGVPITLPGWIYSIVTWPAGFGFSSSGMTIYAGGSANGKDMLDCYGRGIQPIVTPDPRLKVKDFIAVGFRHGFVTGVANFAIYSSLIAVGAEPLVHTTPAFIPHREDYTSGFTFLFRLDGLTEPNLQLPAHLRNRAVNLETSKEADVNWKYLMGGSGHDNSQNGQQFNPDLYLKLHKPYALDATFNIGSEPQRTPDGTKVDVRIEALNYGFSESPVYKEDKTKRGGPTYDLNPPGRTGRAFTEARVYKMVMKPGIITNAIDARKVSGDNPLLHYRSNTSPMAVDASTDPCAFFADRLRDGDPSAAASQLTPGTNANSSLPDAPLIENRALGDDANFTCGQVKSLELKMENNQTNQPIYVEPEEIAAETPPGTKVCFAVYYTNYTNDLKTQGNHWWSEGAGQPNWNASHNTPNDKTQLSRAHCIIAGYKPSLQVRGGDALVNENVDTGVNEKEFLASTRTPDKEVRTYGSWAEYGIIAGDRINKMSSGSLYRTGMPEGWDDIGYLTFSNHREYGGGMRNKLYGHYKASSTDALDDGFGRVARQFTAMSADAQPLSGEVDLADPAFKSGVYRVDGSATLTSSADHVGLNKSVVILASPGATITIAANDPGKKNIKIPNSYPSISELSQVVIAPAQNNQAFRINIHHTITDLDAWLINPAGTINTCYTGVATGIANTPRAGNDCHNMLEINGPVSAKNLLLRRTGGQDQGTETEIRQSRPAESFNLRPDSYIWAAEYVNAGGKKYVTTHAKDLPPRY